MTPPSLRATLVTTITLAAIVLTGCAQEDNLLTKKQFNHIRRTNIELVNDAAPHVATKKGQSSEELGACTDLGPDDQQNSDFDYSGPVRDDAMDYITNTLGPRLKAEGWTYRDRTVGNDAFDRIWAKDNNTFGIAIESTKNANPPYVVLTTVSPCANAPGIDTAEPRSHDPWYIPLDSHTP